MSAGTVRYEYDVFTRINRGDDLVHVGAVVAPTDELAKIYAQYIYDEENWVEMCVVRRDRIHWVKQPEGLFKKEGVGQHG
jgi:1,2-phenylacetyl-CoA epoxidase PaaB subunit